MYKNIISRFINDPFFVSDLDKSYALRQVAPFKELQTNAPSYYENMNEHELTLFRSRISSDEILTSRKSMVHRPYKSNEKISQQRFTCNEMPALYLAATSYTCWLETGKSKNSFYVSAFKANEEGKKLKILNLIVTEEMINGFYNPFIDGGKFRNKELQKKLIILWPLVFATSFKIKNHQEAEKTEYIIPELVMRCLKELDIDGITYVYQNLWNMIYNFR